LYGLPTLVFDAGTALTYTALDAEGNILGGGIGPGVQLALTSLHKATAGRLPHISLAEMQQQQEEEQKNQELTCNLFETNTKDAILSTTLEQTLTWIRLIIAGWLHLVGERPMQPSNTHTNGAFAVAEYVSSLVNGERTLNKCNDDRTVVFTGGDGDLLNTLLTKRIASASMPNSGITAYHDENETTSTDSVYMNLVKVNNSIMSSCSTAYHGHLIHLGIAHTLLLRSKKKDHRILLSMPPREEFRKIIEGATVVKKTKINQNIAYLYGIVLGLHEIAEVKEAPESTTKFIVSFEDGSRSIVNLEELNGKARRSIHLHSVPIHL
jgi:hypothetical protein